ncbi:DUF6299 family protein [Streptomyces lacrimifluminis]|uniref:DUF6299 domain-containing protein n=1 Tax=Streptomyces lacrimifluminis TaxID=1500077 RepID=A0A917KWR4_9ACTN|nr:DUF6299 family protein [Streptomyces lacrimifluminis]GGJ29702.1 hypothetical protein GCM10012282_27900 [Streptomyces lacrimifluminis]
MSLSFSPSFPALSSLSRAAAVVVGAVLLAVAPAATAVQAADEGFDQVTVESGSISSDGELTLSGSYRCLSTGHSVRVAASIERGENVWYGMDSIPASCDGSWHQWSNTKATEPGAYKPGPVRVKTSLVEFRRSGFIPMPTVHAEQVQAIVLTGV